MNITTATDMGKRPYQEDQFVVSQVSDGLLAAIFDGHGGDLTSTFAKENVVGLWQSITGQPKVKMASVFRQLNKLTVNNHDGSTASIVFIPTSGRSACIGIMGDSPVVIKDSEGKINISPEHNVRSNGPEADAAIRRGGILANGYLFANRFEDGLQMTRALGDKNLHSVLNRLPEIYTVKISKKVSWILLGSDGLFDPGHQSKLALNDVITAVDSGSEAQNLVDIAVATPTYDNVTAILMRLSK
jgi:serine/threonine protein phosphatase PrpC